MVDIKWNSHMEDKDKLSGLNYLPWSYLIQMLLVHTDLWDMSPFVELTPVLMRASQKALVLIVCNIATALMPVIRVCSACWLLKHRAKLESVNRRPGESAPNPEPTRSALLLVMGSSESMTAFFARACGIWNELQSSWPRHFCESDVFWSLLKGLPSRFPQSSRFE
jgi:hypothetical protein